MPPADWTPASVAEVAALCDHTILAPAATREDVLRVAREGRDHGVATVCVHPLWVGDVAEVLEGCEVKACSVVGFPHGASHPEIIAAEARRAFEEGAREVDMVMPLGWARMGRWDDVLRGIALVSEAIDEIPLKVILEICELDNDQIRRASETAIEAGAEFIKTSTGFGKHGATLEAVRLMAGVASGRAGVKAAGGIRDYDTLLAMVRAGATRIGTSSTLKILTQAAEALGQK